MNVSRRGFRDQPAHKQQSQNQEKCVLITGCSSGIGYCTAKGLKQRGYRVIASARRSESVEQLISEGFECVQLDLADSASIQRAFTEVMQLTDNTLYALFNNGAFALPAAVEDLSRENLKYQFETNVFGWLELTNLVIPVMRKQGFGRIIQNSSVLGFVAMPFRGAYIASKFANEGLSDTLRLELRGSNIFVSLIAPGPIASKFRANAVKELQNNIDVENSVHSEQYRGVLKRLKTEGPAVPFTLQPEAVLKRVIQALEAKKPASHYYVTFPTYLFAFLKRILSRRALDSILCRAGNDDKK